MTSERHKGRLPAASNSDFSAMAIAFGMGMAGSERQNTVKPPKTRCFLKALGFRETGGKGPQFGHEIDWGDPVWIRRKPGFCRAHLWMLAG
jgi:hypothetical protein